MTLSQKAKNEIIKKPLDESYALPELSAIIHTAGSIVISQGSLSVEIISETQNLSRRVQKILKTLYGANIKTGDDFVIGKHMYKTVIPESVASMVLKDCSILELNEQGALSIVKGIDKHLVMDTQGVYAYIRGAFLGGGYITESKNYRLEFVFTNQELADDFQNLLNNVNITSKNILRKNKYVLYLSSSDSICDLLAGIGATAAVLHIYNELANRSVRNTANRTANCINANIDKAVDTAVKQSQAIEIIENAKGLDFLPDKLKEAALARKQYPSATLQEIAEKLRLSKSGLNHRMSKIIEISNKIMEGDDAE
ncbi:MAG TPA: DNA-binding protein WhiA [Clostridia bacterium]